MKAFGIFSRKWLAMSAMCALVAGVAQADLVLDEEAAPAKVEDREQLRKVIKTTQKVETQNEIDGAVTTTVTTAPVIVESAPAPVAAEMPTSTKSELTRRARMREEMKNEDLLQQRLEELRLRDEQRRSQKLLKSAGLADETDEEVAPKAAALTPAPVMKEEQVIAPITERPGAGAQMSPAPQVQQTQLSPIVSDSVSNTQSSYNMSVAPVDGVSTKKSGTNGVSIMPKIGYSSINNNDYKFDSRFTVGLGLGFTVSDHVGLELGYAYSEYELGLGNRYYVPGYYGTTAYERLNYKQNTFDLGMKLYFVNADAKVRPYIGGGAAYSMGYINYSKRTRDMLAMYPQYNRNIADYELNQIMGVLSAGLEFKVADNVSIGGAYKYFAPISSSENDTLYNGGFYGNSIPGSAYDPTKENVRGTIKDSSSHLFQVGASFFF